MKALIFEKARFLLSVPTVTLLPKSLGPEIAFFGRSNVGKSSLINYLSNQKHLARVSKTPGRTQALNLFEAELEGQKLGLIDLPGHGYAKLSLTERERLSGVLTDYLEQRESLTCLIHLLDCRRDPNPEDIALSQQFKARVKDYVVVMTKIDQIVLSKRKDTQKRFAKLLAIEAASCYMISAEKNIGRPELLEHLSQLLGL